MVFLPVIVFAESNISHPLISINVNELFHSLQRHQECQEQLNLTFALNLLAYDLVRYEKTVSLFKVMRLEADTGIKISSGEISPGKMLVLHIL